MRFLKRQDSLFYQITFFVLLLAVTIVCYIKTKYIGVDVPYFLAHGDALRAGKESLYDAIYRQFPDIAYTVFNAITAIPFSFIGEDGTRTFWGVLNAVLFPLAWWITEKFYKAFFSHLPLTWACRGLTLLCMGDVVTLNAIQGNLSVFILFSLSLSLFWTYKKLSIPSGILAGFASSLKPHSGAIGLLFLLNRKWKALLIMVLSFGVCSILVPVILLGCQETSHLYEVWINRIAGYMEAPNCKYTDPALDCALPYLLGTRAPFVFWIVKGLKLAALSSLLILNRSAELAGLALGIPLFYVIAPTHIHDHYHSILLLPYLVIHQMLLSGKLGKSLIILWFLRFIFVHVFVQSLVGQKYSEAAGLAGQHVWGAFIFLLILLVSQSKWKPSTRNH